MKIDGKTSLYALIGQPVAQSFSPKLHSRQFQLNKINALYLAFDLEADQLEDALKGLFALGVKGANVTLPYKEAVIPFLAGISERAHLSGAVNTLLAVENGYYGDNTDGPGFLKSLEEEINFSVKGKKVIIIGAGGAARGVAVSLALEGAKKIVLLNRSLDKAEKLSSLLREKLGVESEAFDYKERLLDEREVKEAQLIINATSLGMYPDDKVKVDFPYHLIESQQLVCDLIYNPAQTLFLKEAKERGASTMNGEGMLYYQAALSFEIWTGKTFERREDYALFERG